ncbi:uncharacterized protein E0L32_011728 [Thyridium curvatum]|uniref:aldehyde dehydrogenase (NAD(+)) n=1 Tax=Thyridium curvatum TaxID=1093900 RepID=A0A507BFT1_9PEZI|nr:uncharacterized protein E0L32_011728 [Thyridium curvatum]TPX18353.1 hypothetical protein E0L32_011728 [Thyridium curvatum]
MAIDTNGTSAGHSISFEKFYNTVNGKLVTTAKSIHGVNPSTLETLPDVPLSTEEDLNAAVTAARNAAPGWAETPLEERQKAVISFADALEALKSSFADMLVQENGKPLPVAQGEVANGAHWLRTQAGLSFPEEVVEDTDDRVIVTRYSPLGVAAAIVPWNFPLMLACGKIAPALITGNALIMKPSPFTPYCGLKLGELAQRFFPPGVFQVLSGDDNLGPWITGHPGIDKISFTGSTATGKRVMESCSKTLKRVTLELGGNDPAIVCEDVDVQDAAQKITQLAFLNSGQICVAIKRVYVHSSIYSEFLNQIVACLKHYLVGDGKQEGVGLGPIQNSLQYNRVKAFLQEIERAGLKVATGQGSLAPAADIGKGYFVRPVVVDNPPDTSHVVVDEPFAPILPLLRWDTDDEVIRRANNRPWV